MGREKGDGELVTFSYSSSVTICTFLSPQNIFVAFSTSLTPALTLNLPLADSSFTTSLPVQPAAQVTRIIGSSAISFTQTRLH
jgi:hypothetical protein